MRHAAQTIRARPRNLSTQPAPYQTMHELRSFAPPTLRALVTALVTAFAAVLVVSAGATPAGAQSRVLRDAGVRATPDGTLIATVIGGTTWPTSTVRAGFTLVTLEVWVDATRFAGRRDSFPESIGGTGTLRMRAEPSLSGRILGVFEAGAGVRVLERRGTWARVRRDGWVLTTALTGVPAVASTPPARATTREPARQAASAAADTGVDTSAREEAQRTGSSRAMRASRDAELRNAPGAPAFGRVEAGAIVEPIARDRGWVRVRVDAWMPESLLVPADTGYRASLTAAELRMDPVGLKGRTVRWNVQVVGLQLADPLRRDMAPDEPYLLAMGPGGENAILYLALPPSLVSQARALPPLSEVTVTARVRTGRSDPTGAPILDVISLVKR